MGERSVPNRPNYYYYQLLTRELVFYCAERKRNWRGELTEAITIEYLVPQEILKSQITGGSSEPPVSTERQVASSGIWIVDNSQRLIFVVQVIVTIGLTILMLSSQFSSGSLGEKTQQPPSEYESVP